MSDPANADPRRGSPAPPTDPAEYRRRVAHYLYTRFAFASFLIWTLGTLLIFILYAAPNPRPIFPAMLSMTIPLPLAALIWVAYWPLVSRLVARGWTPPSPDLSPTYRTF